jgi:DNA-binding transcriptional ArsR family regulator
MRSLPPAFRAGLAKLSETLRHPPEPVLNPHPDPGADIETLLEALQATADANHPGVSEFVADFWEIAFCEEWTRAQPRLDVAAEAMATRIADQGLLELLDGLAPWISAIPARNEVRLSCTSGEDAEPLEQSAFFDVHGLPVTVIPSLFAAPHVYVDAETPAALQFIAPVTAIVKDDAPPDNLVGSLLACASDARLRLLRALAEQPRTVQELAPMLSMAPSTVSRHLQRLAEYGLVTSERDGWYVLNQLCRSRIRDLVGDLIGYVDA